MKPHKRKILHKRRIVATHDSSSSSGTEEWSPRQSRSRRTVLTEGKLRQGDDNLYDADSEPSSANESLSRNELQTYHVDEEISFSFFDRENIAPMESDMESSQDELAKNVKSNGDIMVPAKSFYSSLKKEGTPGMPLRVSFADESLDDIDRPSRRSNKTSITSSNMEALSSTPVPSILESPFEGNKVLRVSLPRLSDVASPILIDDVVSLKRGRRVESKETHVDSLSSGYESMLKSNTSESKLEEPVSRKRRASTMAPSDVEPMDTEATNTKVVVENKKPKSAKEQKRAAIEKWKLVEQRLMDEMEELEDYELCVE